MLRAESVDVFGIARRLDASWAVLHASDGV
jgi:hypothetical protein